MPNIGNINTAIIWVGTDRLFIHFIFNEKKKGTKIFEIL